MSSVEGPAKRYLSTGFLKWWGRWWLDTRGPVLGVAVPGALALLAAALDARLIPLAVAGGLAVALLWPMGMAARGLAITGRYVTAAHGNRSPRTTVKESSSKSSRGKSTRGVRYRSAITGRYVTAATAQRHPNTTVAESS